MGGKHSKGTISTSHRVPFAALQEATNNFDEKFLIADGGFGKVYRGVLCDGTKVALKMYNFKSQQNDLKEFQTEIEILSQSQQGVAEFQTEIMILSQLRHTYLVSLIGYCDENNEMILIYEYMENGNLKRHLYGSDLPTMSWEQRLEICIGEARGLHYLHNSGITHRDVKSPNILLDENFLPKIADFGLSMRGPKLEQTHVSTVVRGLIGYLDPEYFVRQQLTEKSDVYSFGIVLCEVVCARPAVDQSLPREQVNLAEWAMNWQKKGQLKQIIDPNLQDKVRPDSLRKFGETAAKCLAHSGVDRPSMGEVLWILEYALRLQEPVIQDNPEENSTN